MKRVVWPLSALLCRAWLAMSITTAAAWGTTLTVQTSPLAVTSGSSYNFDVTITGAIDLYSYGFDITFDSSLLSAISITEGPLLPSAGATIFFSGVIDNIGGTINFNGGSLTGPIPGVTGSGVLVSFGFTAIADGTAIVGLLNPLVLDSLGNDIPLSEGSSAVPEPSSALLLIAVLPAALILRRRQTGNRHLGLCLAAVLAPLALRGADITTAQFDNDRTMSNPAEIYLTRANVNAAKFGKLFARTVDGAIFAQPLYLENVFVQGRLVNIVYVATMHNVVYAFDADSPSATAPLWSRNLGAYATASGWSTGMGIGSTPLIYRSLQAMYVVAATAEAGHRVFRLHALDLATGNPKFGGPTVISGQVPGTAGEGANGLVPFLPDQQIQRAGLAAASNSVYIPFSADRDHLPYHGWVFGYNLTNLSQTAIFNTSRNAAYLINGQGRGYASGIWQSGRAPAVDAAGAIYLETGNGDYDGVTEFGNSVLKLNTDSSGALSLADWFTPYDWSALNLYDLDLGSTGPLLLPGTSRVIAGSKTGLFYLLNRTNLGHIQTGNAQTVQNFLGTSGCTLPLDFQVCAQIMGQAFSYGATTPALYVWAVHDTIKAYQLSGGVFATAPSSVGSLVAPYPGGVLAHSGYRTVLETGIVWALTSDVPDGGFYFGPGFAGTGTLRAFNSSNLTQELWNSSQNSFRDAMGNLASFTTPLVANGKVYVPTLSNQLVVYGLLNGPVAGDVNGDSVVGCADVAVLRNTYSTTSAMPRFDARADIVRDGVINIRDLTLVSRSLPAGTTCP